MTILEGQEALAKQYQSCPDTFRLSAFNTYQEVTRFKLAELGGVATNVNDAILDRGDRGGYWQFPDQKSFFAAYDWMASRSLLPQCLAHCTCCEEDHPLFEFGKGNRPNGRACQCKKCSAKRKRVSSTPVVTNPPKNGSRKDAIAQLDNAIGVMTSLIEQMEARVKEDQVLLDSYVASRQGLEDKRQELLRAEGA